MSKITWYPVELSNPTAIKAYEDYKETMAKAKAKREELEKILRPKAEKHCPKGHEVIFSYRFGRIAVAFTESDGGSQKTPDNALTL